MLQTLTLTPASIRNGLFPRKIFLIIHSTWYSSIASQSVYRFRSHCVSVFTDNLPNVKFSRLSPLTSKIIQHHSNYNFFVVTPNNEMYGDIVFCISV